VLPDSEAQSGPTSGNPVREALHEDRDRGVKVVLATQDPTDLYYPPIKQCRHLVMFAPSSFHTGFLRYYDIESLEYPTEAYHYAVVRPSLPPEVVYRGVTDPRYG